MVDDRFSKICLSQGNCAYNTNIALPRIREICACEGEKALQHRFLKFSKDGLVDEIWLFPWSIVG